MITINNVGNTGLSYSNNWNDKEVVLNSNLYPGGKWLIFFFYINY